MEEEQEETLKDQKKKNEMGGSETITSCEGGTSASGLLKTSEWNTAVREEPLQPEDPAY